MPKIFSHLMLLMFYYPHKCSLCHCYLVINDTCQDLLSFNCLQRSKIILLMLLLKELNTSFTLFPIMYGVLSSALFAKSTLFITENKSYIKMLINKVPKMEPWETPKKIFYELYAVFIFVLCFLWISNSAPTLRLIN